MSIFRNREWWGLPVALLLPVAAGLILQIFTLGVGVVHLSLDLLLVARPQTRPKEALIIYLDEQSHRKLNQLPNVAWDRALHAKLVERLTEAGARAVVFDVVFSGPGPDPEADQALAQAIERNGKVILAVDAIPIEESNPLIDAKAISLPYEPFLDAGADIGSVQVATRDLIIRQPPDSFEDPLPSLSWATASFLKAPATANEANRYAGRWVNYYGEAGILPHMSYFEALDPERTAPELFRDKVVFIGARLLTKFAGERKDEYRTPFSFWMSGRNRNLFISGVEIQTTLFLNLLRGDWLTRTSPLTERAVLVLAGLLFGYGLLQLRPLPATGAAVITMPAVAIIAYAMFVSKRLWFPWVLIELQIAVALLWSVVFNSFRLYLQKRLLEQSLSLYLSPKLVKKFANRPDLLKPGAEKQPLTLLFSDIANFTSLSERMDSDQLAKLMNNYFETAVSQCIHKTDGTVVKYIGDAIFAFWNAPEQQVDHAERACAAALAFGSQEFQPVNGKPLCTRIGLHTGVANVGNFGSTARVDYTAIGEDVNLASRMEGLNKYLGTTVLMSHDTNREMAERFVTRFLGNFRLKGFEKTVGVYELIGLATDSEPSREWRELFAKALEAFQQRRFDDAETCLRRVLELRPDDGPSKFYLAQIAEMHGEEFPENWAGEITLKEK